MESYPKFHNEVGVPIVRIGCREFKCIGDKPPQDHPHIFDLSYLGNLGSDRVITNVAVGAVKDGYRGVLAKCAMSVSLTTETLYFPSGPAKALHESFKRANADGRLPKISDQENDNFIATMPKIEDYDWNQQNELSRIVLEVRAISFTDAMGFEFVMQDGAVRQFLIPTKVARFFGEYVHQYRQNFEDHKDSTSDGH